MYNFIYFVIYNQQIQKGSSQTFARYNGSLIVALALIGHASLVLLSLKKVLSNFFAIEFPAKNKVVFLPFVILFILLALLYYNSDRTKEVIEKFTSDKDPVRILNFVKVLSIIFVPVIFGVILQKIGDN